MSSQSSGSSAPSASGVTLNADGIHSLGHVQAAKESDIEATVTANLAQDEPLQRRHRPRSSGGFLLQTSPAHSSERRLSTHSEPDSNRDVRGKRKAEEGDLFVPKRASARQRHRQKPSLGGSPLATEVISVHSSENGPKQRDKRSSVQSATRQSMHSSFNSNGTSIDSASRTDPAMMSNEKSAIGHDTNPAQIVNLAVNLSESRRRNFSSGGLLIPRDVVGARRIMSSGQQTLLPNSTSGGSLRQHLQYQRQVSRNVSPRSGKSGRSSNSKESGFASQNSQKEQVGKRQSALLPGVDAGFADSIVFDASDATIARAEKARVVIELMYEYRRLLQYLPPIPTHSKRKSAMSKSVPKHQSEPSTGLGRVYNPLQYIRNRKVRFRQRRPLDAETAGWKNLDRVRTWVDIVASEREDGLSRIDRPLPLPSLDTIGGGYPPADGSQNPSVPISAGSQTKKVGRPRMDWDFTPWDLLADAHWLDQDDNIDLIEDSSGKKITTGHPSCKDYTPRGSFESNSSSVRRSGSIIREHASPDRVRALAGHSRKDSKDRGRRSVDVHEPQSPRLEDNGSQDRKSRWPKKLVRSRSSSDSDEFHLESRSRKNRGRDNPETAALEKQMMDMLTKEAEASRQDDLTSEDDADTKVKLNSKHHDGDVRYIFEQRDTTSRPNAPPRMRTDMPVTLTHPVSARASLDEERFHHHRMSSDDLELTTPNSPVAPGLVPSIAINLSPPASPPSAAASPMRTLTSRGGSSHRDRSQSVNRRINSESDPDSSGTTGLSRQTTSESQLVNMLRKEKSTGFRNGLLIPVKTETTSNTYRPLDGGSIRSIKDVNGSDSRFRGLFKGGRIAELVGSEVSRVGDMFWRKDNSHRSRIASPASSYAPSEESDIDDEEINGLDSSPKNDLFRARTKDGGSLSKVSTTSEKPRYYTSNLPTFRSSLKREEQSPQSNKASPDHDHISRQQLAQRERGRSSRFDRLAPPKIDMSGISLPSSREPSPNLSRTGRAHGEDSRQSSSSRSDRRVRSADRRLNAVLGDPGQLFTGRAPATGLTGLESRARESPQRPELEGKRQWSITDRGLSSVSGIVDKRDIARVRALLLSSGVKANEIARRAEEIPGNPSPFFQGLQGLFKGPVPHVPRSQEPLLAAKILITNIETNTQRLRDDADHFIHTTIEELHDQIKVIDQHVTYKLIPLARTSADDADTISTELTTTHTLAIKQLNDSVDYILRRRRRRLRYGRRIIWATLEWTLLGIMWMVWLVVVFVRLLRRTVGGLVGGLRWLFWL